MKKKSVNLGLSFDKLKMQIASEEKAEKRKTAVLQGLQTTFIPQGYSCSAPLFTNENLMSAQESDGESRLFRHERDTGYQILYGQKACCQS